jgi:hypothetical protein
MILAAFILGRDAGSEDLHMQSVLLDTIADATAAAGGQLLVASFTSPDGSTGSTRLWQF